MHPTLPPTRRIAPLVALVAALATSPAHGEGSPPDTIAATGGHTSLLALAPLAPSDGLNLRLLHSRTPGDVRSSVEVWLHRDHATFRQRVVGLTGAPVGIYAGSGPVSPEHMGLRDGHIPAVTGLRHTEWSDPGGALRPAGGTASEVLWRWWPAWGSPYVTAWTVPYGGNTYGSIFMRDCNCGEPSGTRISHTMVTVRTGDLGHPGLSADVSLTVRNHSGARVTVFAGKKRVARLAAGETWETRTTGARLTFSFLDGWRPGRDLDRGEGDIASPLESWNSRLDTACSVDEERTPPDATRLHYICSAPGRRGARYRFGDASAELLRWFLAAEPPRTLADWPALRDDTLDHRPLDLSAVPVIASSTLPSRRDRYAAAHVFDGDPTTAWCEGARGDGMGETLTFDLPAGRYTIGIVPGYVRSDWHLGANGAPRRIGFGERHPAVSRRIRIPTSADLLREGQDLDFPNIRVSGGRVTLTLEEVRRGTTFEDTCIAELVVIPARR